MAIGAALREQRLPGGALGRVDRSEHGLRPGRRLELAQQLLEPVEIV